jgi:hypothetical protein
MWLMLTTWKWPRARGPHGRLWRGGPNPCGRLWPRG